MVDPITHTPLDNSNNAINYVAAITGALNIGRNPMVVTTGKQLYFQGKKILLVMRRRPRRLLI